jgi:hypothetical protein
LEFRLQAVPSKQDKAHLKAELQTKIRAMESAIKCLRADDSYQIFGQESSTLAKYF